MNGLTVSTMDCINILFKEYESLRAEIRQLTGNGHQAWGIAAVVLTWLLSRPTDERFWMLLGVAGILLAVSAWTTFRDIKKAAKRLREIETQINELAGIELLEWENHWGSEIAGFWRRGKKRTIVSY
jgi:hypothetical protein